MRNIYRWLLFVMTALLHVLAGGTLDTFIACVYFSGMAFMWVAAEPEIIRLLGIESPLDNKHTISNSSQD